MFSKHLIWNQYYTDDRFARRQSERRRQNSPSINIFSSENYIVLAPNAINSNSRLRVNCLTGGWALVWQFFRSFLWGDKWLEHTACSHGSKDNPQHDILIVTLKVSKIQYFHEGCQFQIMVIWDRKKEGQTERWVV